MRTNFKIYCFILLVLLFIPIQAWSTHNRAGEITIQHVSGYTYEITVTTFTYTLSPADRNELEVHWGDNSSTWVKRVEELILPDDYKLNKYIATHTYPGPGVYEILVQDPNRNFGVKNIPNSVQTIFSIKTIILIDPLVGSNSTPILLNFPVDKAALGHVFIHNPGAYDPDGDSLSYKITVCTKENGIPIENYTLPPYSDTLYVDAVTGNLVWDAPTETGLFNIAIDIEEWRKGIKIGNVVRDMQIQVYDSDNEAPEIFGMKNFCVIAGDTVKARFYATDANDDSIFMGANGGPFEVSVNPARIYRDTTFIDRDTVWGQGPSGIDTVTRIDYTYYYDYPTLHFFWATHCSHVQKQPYTVILRAEDDASINLVSFEDFQIRVIGPPTLLVDTKSTNNTITVSWERNPCQQVTGYDVYRKENVSSYIPDSCETGIPSSIGFEKIGQTNSAVDTFFIDNNNDMGLQQGVECCYRIVARYRDGAESIVSNELCDMVVPGTPALIKTSVTKIGQDDGKVLLQWLKPTNIDTSASGPYEYIIYRSDNLQGLNALPLDSFPTTDLTDTTYIDSLLNTFQYPYSYRVELYNDEEGKRFLIGEQELSSTMYSEIENLDNKIKLYITYNVPWVNTEFIVFRENPQTPLAFDSIGITHNGIYVDSNLANNKKYCYRVETYGYRQIDDKFYYTNNLSHKNCGIPIDTFPSCPPVLTVNSVCDSFVNILHWTNPNTYCADDVVGYYVYYKSTLEGDFPPEPVQTVSGAENTTFIHTPAETMAGCYVVTSIDSVDNESDYSNIVCVDECIYYKLPNVFSPDGDGVYDIYQAENINDYVKEVDMKIYNRWGDLVFETTDPDIMWDGTKKDTKKIVSPGVYYYVCDVYEPRINGITVRNLAGFIYVFTDKKTVTPDN